MKKLQDYIASNLSYMNASAVHVAIGLHPNASSLRDFAEGRKTLSPKTTISLLKFLCRSGGFMLDGWYVECDDEDFIFSKAHSISTHREVDERGNVVPSIPERDDYLTEQNYRDSITQYASDKEAYEKEHGKIPRHTIIQYQVWEERVGIPIPTISDLKNHYRSDRFKKAISYFI